MAKTQCLALIGICLAIALPSAQCNGYLYADDDRKPNVVELSEKNWDLMLKDEWMVEFYAPWCPACMNFKTTWEEFSSWTGIVGVHTGRIDVTKSPGLSGRFFVTALPTIFHVKDGQFRQYRGGRDINSLMTFIDEKKWQNVEQVSTWKKPDSIQMAIVSYFFKLSHFLKEVNSMLLRDYGLPPFASYAIFAVATILMGGLLGLLLVCVIDCLFPPKHLQRTSFSEHQSQNRDQGSGDDIRGDELEDEDMSSGSDKEKYSGTDTEDDDEEKDKVSPPPSPRKATPKGSPTSSPDVRKRKARKAE